MIFILCIKNFDLIWNNRSFGKVSGCFYEGQITVIKGDNGVGKTTLLYQIALLKETKGEYIYNDTFIDIYNPSYTHQFRQQNIYMLLQELSLFDDMRLKDYLDLMKGNREYSYDIMFPLNKRISDFSLGEKQYILIYGGFLQDKAIYLFDEPTSALDKNLKLKSFQLLKQLKERGKSLLWLPTTKI